MFLVRKPQYHLFRHDNVWIKFNSYFDLLQYILKQRRNSYFYIGKTLEDTISYKDILEVDVSIYVQAIVYNYDFCIIEPADIEKDLIKYKDILRERILKLTNRGRIHWNKSHNKIFRCDPVSNLYSGRYRHYNYYKYVRTAQEIRMSLSCDKKYIRTKRNYNNLPTNWDDKPRSKRTKGWKNSKKLKQWE